MSELVRIEEVCRIAGDSIDPQLYPNEVFAHYSIPAFDNGQAPVLETGSSILSNKVVFPRGAVLFSKLNPRISRVWHVDDETEHERICSTEFLPLVPNLKRLNPNFLVFALQEPKVITSLRRRVAAATKSRERLTPEIVAKAEIPLPDLYQQQAIVMDLTRQMSAVERARKAAEVQFATAKALPSAFLREEFSEDRMRHWNQGKIGSLARLQSGYAFKSEWFHPDGIRLLRNANVFQGFVSWKDSVCLPEARRNEFQNYELAAGDIVLSLDRPMVAAGLKIARLTQNDVPSLLLQRVGRFSIFSDQLSADYLYLFLNSRIFIEQIRGHDQSLGVPHISPTQVESIEIPLPSIEEQAQIVSAVELKISDARHLTRVTKERLDVITKLPNALLSRGFNGHLDHTDENGD